MKPLSVRTRLTLWYTTVLLGILLLTAAVSYAVLGRTLQRDLDESLLIVAQVIADTDHGTAGTGLGAFPEQALRELLGPEFYDKFFQILDPHGQPGVDGPRLRSRSLPLSPKARANAAEGRRTLETVWLNQREPVRLLTLPVTRGGQVVELLQVGMSLNRLRQTLRRYLETLLVLVPLWVGLTAAGGAAIARAALRPVDEMSQLARRITAEDLSQRIPLRGSGDELDRLAATLSTMLARLEDAFGEMRRFAADAAHELRTPLTALRGGIEVALRADRPAPEYRRVLASTLEDVNRLIRLAEGLLLLSRSAAGAGSRIAVDLEPLILEVFDEGLRLAHGRDVRVRLGGMTPATVVGDGAALRRAVLNLVENAVKYTPAGGMVELALSRAEDAAQVVVQDTGIGIDPADAERVFRPFVRLEAARTREAAGAGLGLAIARSIVLAHGGTLTVESTPGAGSRFTIRLPLVASV